MRHLLEAHAQLIILSHSRSASINKALRHRGDQVDPNKKTENLGFSSCSLSLRHFSSCAFVSVSTHFLGLLISIYSPSESARTHTYEFGGKRVGCLLNIACLGFEAFFCP